jgi:hypothetical protein
MDQSNSLVFKTSKTTGQETIYISIRLDDKCGNGHQDFSITADVYEHPKSKASRYFAMGGCCHEEILKHFPEFKIFVDLHLCDYLGNPMYAVANGLYHLQNGFNNTKPDAPNFKEMFYSYYRITPEQYDVLSTSEDKAQYWLNLSQLQIPEQWKSQADKAIAILEELTQTKFVVDSQRTQLDKPTDEEIAESLTRMKEGYYTPLARKGREEKAKQDFINELEKDHYETISEMTTELNIKKQVFLIAGEKALGQTIFYKHKNKIAFNWMNYDDKLTPETIQTIKDNLILPVGVTYEN